ncbi:MAG: nucleotide exchange factor GrpE [Aquificota bacterium]|nr:MAG: nucleotide exchange factor GrpE [Aquificota bacterium]
MEEQQRQEENQERLKELEEKISKLEQNARLVNQRYVELLKEYEYLKERYRKDLEELKRYGHERLAYDLLEVVDNFERALNYEGKDLEGFKKGVELIYRELLRILEKHGVRALELEGQVFDPYLAEAVDKEFNPDLPQNTVLRVERKGYVIYEKVLRPAKVVVSYAEEEIT